MIIGLLLLFSQAAAPCSAEELRRVFLERLSALTAESGARVPAGLEAQFEWRKGALWLVVQGKGYRRTLQVPSDDCTLAAEAAALSVERHLIRIHLAGTPPRPLAPAQPAARSKPPAARADGDAQVLPGLPRSPEPSLAEAAPEPPLTLAEVEPAPPGQPLASAPQPAQDEDALPEDEPPMVTAPQAAPLEAKPLLPRPREARRDLRGFGLSAGPAAMLASDGSFQPGFRLELYRRTPRWQISLSYADAPPQREQSLRFSAIPGAQQPGGTSSSDLKQIAFSASRCGGEGVRACAGPYLALRSTTQPDQPGGFEPALGLSLGLDFALTQSVHLGLTAMGGTPLRALVQGDAPQSLGPAQGQQRLEVTAAATLGLFLF